MRPLRLAAALGGLLTLGIVATVGATEAAVSAASPQPAHKHTITVPGEDRFTPFAVTAHVGERVTWVNKDTDDHTVVSDDTFTTTDHKGINHLIPGTVNNHGKPGTFTLIFHRPGTFVYYCRFHSHLDAFKQPVAPGPDGGIQDAKGNFGTPMMGIVTVQS